jgi:protein phosphatase
MPPLSFAALSHAGVRRETNEDCYCVRPDLGLFVVADGMGGHVAGEIASRVAVEAIQTSIGEARDADRLAAPVEPALGRALEEERITLAIQHANRRIAEWAGAATELSGMATTVAALLVDVGSGLSALGSGEDQGGGYPIRAVVAHVGDSRVYRWRSGRFELLTRDHSWVQDQISSGALTAQQGRAHPWRHLVTRALTGAAEVNVDVRPITLEPGDRLLLCSDGLPSALSDEEIIQIVGQAEEGDLDGICETLVHAANLAGGPDNITVILVSNR